MGGFWGGSEMVRAFSLFNLLSKSGIILKMDKNFDQAIFGQLIQPVKLASSLKPPQNTQETPQQNSLHNSHNNQQAPTGRQTSNSLLQPSRPTLQHLQKSAQLNRYHYEKQLSSRSTEIGGDCPREAKGAGPVLVGVRKIGNQDVFACGACQGEKENRECLVCRGLGQVRGNDSMARFLEYMIEFKLGLKPAYTKLQPQAQNPPQKQKQKNLIKIPKETAKPSTRNSLPSQIYSSYSEFKQKRSLEARVHSGYRCDQCNVSPIVGIRYHCNEEACGSDYDLCENCYFQYDHQHNMEEIRECQIHRKLEIFSSLLCPGSKTKNVSTMRIFSSSIY